MIFWIRIALMVGWLFFTSAVAAVACLWRRDMSINRDYAHAFGWGMLKLAGIRLQVGNYERIHAQQPCIYVGNHQGVMDVATFGRIYPSETLVIGKRELIWVPFFGLIFWAGGNILINREKKHKAIGSIGAAVEAIRARRASIWIFPEGTRNKTDALMLPFKKGAFHMAVQAGVPIVPLVCAPIAPLISWKDKTMPGGTLRINVLPSLMPNPAAADPVQDLSDRTRAVMEEELRKLV